MISMKETLNSSGSANAKALDSQERVVLEVPRSADPLRVLLGPVVKPFVLDKSAVSLSGLASTAIPATESSSTPIRILRQSLEIGNVTASFSPSGQIPKPINTVSLKDSVNAILGSVGNVDIVTSAYDAAGETGIGSNNRVDLERKKSALSLIDRGGQIGTGSEGDYNSGSYRPISVAIYRKSDGKIGAVLENVIDTTPLGTYSLQTSGNFIYNDSRVGSLTPQSNIQICIVGKLAFNAPWAIVSGTTVTKTITSSGGVSVSYWGNSIFYVKGPYQQPVTYSIAWRMSGQTTWQILGGVSNVDIIAPRSDNGENPGSLANSISVNQVFSINARLNVTLKEAIAPADLGVIVFSGNRRLLDSANGLSVPGLSLTALTSTRIEFEQTATVVGWTETTPTADQIYLSTDVQSASVVIAPNVNAVGYRVWVNFISGGWKPAAANYTDSYLIYDGVDNKFNWDGQTIRVDPKPTVNSTNSYPATYDGKLELITTDPQATELMIEPGDVFISAAGGHSSIRGTPFTVSMPVTFTEE